MTQPARKRWWLIAVAILLAAAPSRAADLRLGLAVETDSIDPHFHYFGGTLGLTSQIYDPLVAFDEKGALQPALATTWRAIADDAWQFDLRPNVKFQDGTPFTPEDVVFTYTRARDVPRSPASFAPSLRSIASVEVTGPLQVTIHTHGPAPLLPAYLANIGIVSHTVGATATTEDYNTGKAAIGTGPYRFVSWSRGDSVVLQRNDSYWGPAPPWDKVRIRAIPNPAARVAALLAGDVDLIDSVPIEDTATIKANAGLRLREAVSEDVIAFVPDVAQRKPPFITANDGSPLDKNPLADLRVRQAVQLAVNRDLLKDRIMSGQAALADQLMPPGQYGHDPAITVPKPDPAKAKALLAEAGYPDGFKVTMQCQSDRFPKGPELCQAVAQMLTRVGIKTEPVPVPHAIFIGHANKHEYSLFTAYMLGDTFEPSATMLTTFVTASPVSGNFNRGQYSSKTVDDLVYSAQRTIDPAAREKLLDQAAETIAGDLAVWPVLRPLNIEAMRAGLDHTPRADGKVAAAAIHSAPSN